MTNNYTEETRENIVKILSKLARKICNRPIIIADENSDNEVIAQQLEDTMRFDKVVWFIDNNSSFDKTNYKNSDKVVWYNHDNPLDKTNYKDKKLCTNWYIEFTLCQDIIISGNDFEKSKHVSLHSAYYRHISKHPDRLVIY
jgi:hypothetical protein